MKTKNKPHVTEVAPKRIYIIRGIEVLPYDFLYVDPSDGLYLYVNRTENTYRKFDLVVIGSTPGVYVSEREAIAVVLTYISRYLKFYNERIELLKSK